MPRPRRNTNPEYIRLVTIRTENASFYMVPDKELNQIVGGIIAKYQQEFEIVMYGYIFLSNHYHLLIKAPKENLWRFEQAVNREIARRVNRLRSREGHFWGRRYDEQIALEPADVQAALLYIICNAVKHGLVNNPFKWPGVNCLRQILNEKDREFYFTNYTAYIKAKRIDRNVRIFDFRTKHTLKITPIPVLASSSKKERRKFIRAEIQSEVAKYNAETNKFLGEEKILRQNPFSRPENASRRNRPLCYTKSLTAKLCFLKEIYWPWTEWFESASKIFRSGKLEVEFPPYCIKPPLLYLLSA